MFCDGERFDHRASGERLLIPMEGVATDPRKRRPRDAGLGIRPRLARSSTNGIFIVTALVALHG